MTTSFRKVLRDLLNRPLRSALTILGIVVGVAGLLAIVATGQNLVRAQAAAFAAGSRADLTVFTWNADRGLARTVEALPNVATAELRSTLATKWQVGRDWQDVYLIGVNDFSAIDVNRIEAAEGDFPAADEIMPEIAVRDLARVAVGQPLLVRDRQGQTHDVTLSGFAYSPAALSPALTQLAVAYAPAEQVRRWNGATGDNALVVRFDNFAARDETIADIQRLLRQRGLPIIQQQVRDPDNFVGKREMDALVRVLGLFSALGLLLSGFLAANTLSAIAAEGTREIGVMKAVGATPRQVLLVYLSGALTYGVIGTLIGLPLGAVVGAWLYHRAASLTSIGPEYSVPPQAVALGVLVGLGVTLVAGLPAALSAARVTVREAMSAQGVAATFGKRPLERALAQVRGLPRTTLIAVRNLGRRLGRNVVTLLMIALAVASFLAARTTSASVDTAVEAIFRAYNADAWLSLGQPVAPTFAGQLRATPGVTQAEPWSLTNGFVRQRRVRVWGVPADTRLYTPALVAGRWLRVGAPDEVVVSADVARERDIQVGDTVALTIGDRERPLTVVGILVDNAIFLGSSLAGKVFAPTETVDRLRDRAVADFFALSVADPRPEAVDTVLADLESRARAFRPATEAAHADRAAAANPARLLSGALWAMAVLVGLIGALGVLNTLTLNVIERRREIGVMRVIGARDRQVASIFVTEGLALGLAGWLLGVGLGYLVGWGFVGALGRALFPMAYVFPWPAVAASLLFALLLAGAASLLPALAAARLPAATALRYE